MTHEIQDKLRDITVETLERYCSIFPASDVSDTHPLQSRSVHVACVDFHGPFHGTLGVTIPEKVLADVLRMMIGEQSSYSAREELDTIGEIANVICGNILPYIAGPHSIFKIDPPRNMTMAEAHRKSLLARSELRMEKGAVEVVLYRDL